MPSSDLAVSSIPKSEANVSGDSNACSRKWPTNWLATMPAASAAVLMSTAPSVRHSSRLAVWKTSGWNASKPLARRSGRLPAMSRQVNRSLKREMKYAGDTPNIDFSA